ncbi:hypothetical protein AOQ84DRAFT_412145 [Glonium stellatum]|uniref:Heterokaryon incompatibility domain-containing protein n=1 Tax=Glonium stellatum TaxID=574774 RepID=A0A8E2EW16_9PEZI|nr:hypothetical protein AOQ84DRAFT_412145 [Glonium stellatum]
MDHIPTPLDSLPSIEIPVSTIVPYDFQGFVTFPSRHGFGSERPLGEEQSANETASLMQSWLYFGLLAEFFGEPMNVGEFACKSREPCTQTLLCSAPLNRLMKSYSPDKARQQLLLQEACEKLRIFVNSPHYRTSPVLEIELSIRVLIHALGNYADCPANSQTMHPLIENRLLESGWCPSQVVEIGRYENEVVAYYLCRLRRPNPYNVSHHGCSKIQCIANNISGHYQNRHTHRSNPRVDEGHLALNSTVVNEPSRSNDEESKPCRFVHVNIQAVQKIIEKGGVPLISIETLSSGGLELRVRAATARDRYIAISHVWSDGLGNPALNALPRCQLERLDFYFRNLPHPSSTSTMSNFSHVHSFASISVDLARMSFIFRRKSRPTLFWMDTLCIPVGDDAKAQELKNRAINQMAFIYSMASQVLILDSALQLSRIGGLQKSELLARINYSGWMGRCWTLQEGALTPFCYFQCADGALNPLAHFPQWLEDEDLMDSSLAKFRLMTLWQATKIFRSFPRSISKKWKPPSVWGPWFNAQLNVWSVTLSMRRKAKMPTKPCQDIMEEMVYRSMFNTCIRYLHVSGYSRSNAFFPERTSNGNARWIQHLVAVWNLLAKRSTTKSEDVPAIFANLLGFNSYQILKLSPEERLRAILWSCDVLPLSLLYNPGPKMHQGMDHKNRWVPSVPSRYLLEEAPLMYFNNDKSLVFGSKTMTQASKPIIFLIEECPLRANRESVFRGPDGEYWRVESLCSQEDCLDISQYQATCFIFKKQPISNTTECAVLQILQVSQGEMSSSNQTNGDVTSNGERRVRNSNQITSPNTGKARNFTNDFRKNLQRFWRRDQRVSKDNSRSLDGRILLESQEVSDTSTLIIGVYDCSMMVQSIDRDTAERFSIINSGKVVTTDWKITILSDAENWKAPFSRLSKTHTSDMFGGVMEDFRWFLKSTTAYMPLMVIVIIASILRIIVAIKLGWHSLHPIGRASLLLWFVQRTVGGPIGFIPISQILFIIDRHNEHHFASLDVAYVTLDLLWSVYFPLAFPYMTQQWLKHRFEKNLATYQEGWEPEKEISTVWKDLKYRLKFSIKQK